MTELAFTDASEWEAWLEANHEAADEVWLVYWKKGTGKPTVAYDDAVETALKFGWIDGMIRTVDAERYKQRWTPRRSRSSWSETNRRTAERLIAAGEMRPRGLAAVESARASGRWSS